MQPERRKAVHDAIARLSDGDRSAMAGLVEHLWPVLLAFARRSLRHEQDGEDVAQEVFVRICSRASEFDRTRDGLSWAFGIASYEVMTARRRTQRRPARVRTRTPSHGAAAVAALAASMGCIRLGVASVISVAAGVVLGRTAALRRRGAG